jgi:hypothetical protein
VESVDGFKVGLIESVPVIQPKLDQPGRNYRRRDLRKSRRRSANINADGKAQRAQNDSAAPFMPFVFVAISYEAAASPATSS